MKQSLKKQNKWHLIQWGVFIGYIFLCLWHLTDICSLHPDETMLAYDAYCLGQYGTDRHGLPFPIYFLNNGGGGSSAPNVYFAALTMKLLGPSIFSIRLPSVIMGAVGMVFFILLMRETFNNVFATIGTILYATTPHLVMRTQVLLDCYFALPFFVIALYFIVKALRDGRLRNWALAGLFLGLTCYSYMAILIPVCLFLLMNLLYFLPKKKITWKVCLALGIPFAICILPLIAVNIINLLGLDSAVFCGMSIPNLTTGMFDYRINELKTFPSFIYFMQFMYSVSGHCTGVTLFNIQSKYGQVTAPVFVLSIVSILFVLIKRVKKEKIEEFMVVNLFMILANAIFFSFVCSASHRVSLVILCAVITSVYAMQYIGELLKDNQKMKKIIMLVVLVIHLCIFVCFVLWYYAPAEKGDNPRYISTQPINAYNFRVYDDVIADYPDIPFDELHIDGIEEEYALTKVISGQDFSPEMYAKLVNSAAADKQEMKEKCLNYFHMQTEEPGIYIIHNNNIFVQKQIKELQNAGTISVKEHPYEFVTVYEIQ